MDRSEAEALAEERGAADPTRTFFARERDGVWEVVSVPAIPGASRPGGTSIEARPRPDADDPRTSNERNLPGLPGGLG